jgi:hypothetical protein
MIITSKFFSFNVWEWFLQSSVLERIECDLSKILTSFVASFYLCQYCWCLGRGFHCVTLLSDLFWLSGIISQSWLWVAWSRGSHQVSFFLWMVTCSKKFFAWIAFSWSSWGWFNGSLWVSKILDVLHEHFIGQRWKGMCHESMNIALLVERQNLEYTRMDCTLDLF